MIPEKYVPFPKIARLSREVVITEKIDGTNGLIQIENVDPPVYPPDGDAERGWIYVPMPAGKQVRIRAGSRTRWITPEDDNYGFAKWVYANAIDLTKLGVGRHFGEWWGQGIGRNYGLTEKRFSLFNVSKWDDDSARPVCCHVVPVLGGGMLDAPPLPGTNKSLSDYYIDYLKTHGSAASPGFMNPEGIIIYHIQGNLYFKKTIEKDEEPKGNKS